MSTSQLENLVVRLEAVVQKLETGAGDGAGEAETARFVEDYDIFVSQYVEPYLKASGVLGDVADEQAKLFKEVCDEERKVLVIASKCSKPSDKDAVKIMANVLEKIKKMNAAKLSRTSDQGVHVKAAEAGSGIFGWTTYPKTPMAYVKETKESVKFYSNKILTQAKNGNKEAEHKAWVTAYVAIFDGLVEYIKHHHTTGLSWNSKGPAATPSTQPSTTVVPPTTVNATNAPVKKPSPAGGMSMLMGELNKGTTVTQGLKKVTRDMQTHKNPELRKHHAPVPYKAPASGGYKPVASKKTNAPVKPPVCELQGKKWVVENQNGAKELKIENPSMKETIYVYKCNNSNLEVLEKVNSIVLDSCKKMGLVFHSVVSGVEIINCQSVQVQAQGKMPTASIDKTDGCILYLNKECVEAHIVTAKSSEMNVCVPKDDGEYEEFPIVEQFRSFYDPSKKTFQTVPSDIIG